MTATALSGHLPKYIGSTGGLLNAAGDGREVRHHLDQQQSPGVRTADLVAAAEMNEGENIMYFARKEQRLALGTQLRTKFKPRIEDFKIYRIFPGGDTEFLHPKDGVFPEKVNEGRSMVGHNARRIGQNPNPANLKFSGRNTLRFLMARPDAVTATSIRRGQAPRFSCLPIAVMPTPDRAAFLDQVAAGSTFIPIARRWPADLETPLSTWLKVGSSASHGVLLESVEGGEQGGPLELCGQQPPLDPHRARRPGGSAMAQRHHPTAPGQPLHADAPGAGPLPGRARIGPAAAWASCLASGATN
jgi:photosystem I subunit 2